MHTETLACNETTRLVLRQVNGDLRLAGEPGGQVRLRVADRDALEVSSENGRIIVTCRTGCLAFLPPDCQVEVGQVSQDLRIQDLKAALSVQNVGGDLQLRSVGEVSVDRVGGDLIARVVSGNLRVGHVGGDARIETISGALTVEAVAGDLRVDGASREVDVRCGGDGRVRMSPAPGTHNKVRAGGDLRCTLPLAPSVRIEVLTAGDIRLPSEARADAEGAQPGYVLGGGEAHLALEASGDVQVETAAYGAAAARGRSEMGGVDAESIGRDVAAALEDLEASGLMHEGVVDAAAIRRLVDEKLRQAGVSRSAPKATRPGRAAAPDRTAPGPEQVSVLQMLQDGKITAEQAETLLRALEGGS